VVQDDQSVVAAGIVSVARDRIERCCGVSRSELMVRAGLDEALLAQPDGQVRSRALMEMIRCAKERSGDPALGLRLASLVDLREQGFWGYAVLSSASLRERFAAHLRYQRMRTPWRLAFEVEAGGFRIELIPQDVPEDVRPILIEWLIATALLHFAEHLGCRPRGLELQLSYGALPHHRELAALFEGKMCFDAPCTALLVPLELLDLALPGDRQLQQLTHGHLDAQLAALQPETPRPLLDRVRERLAARLGGDASLQRIALDLNMHARSLQRQLDAQQHSFQQLLDEARHAQAIALLEQPAQRVEDLAARLGYADAASFRRAFRRWTGQTPAEYRATRGAAPTLTGIVPKVSRKVSGA
jgi:AraC-like DNA-binding protein